MNCPRTSFDRLEIIIIIVSLIKKNHCWNYNSFRVRPDRALTSVAYEKTILSLSYHKSTAIRGRSLALKNPPVDRKDN